MSLQKNHQRSAGLIGSIILVISGFVLALFVPVDAGAATSSCDSYSGVRGVGWTWDTTHNIVVKPGAWCITSFSGQTRLTLQKDGNLVGYKGSRVVFQSKTYNSHVDRMVFRADIGRIEMYDINNQSVWSSSKIKPLAGGVSKYSLMICGQPPLCSTNGADVMMILDYTPPPKVVGATEKIYWKQPIAA